MLCLDHTLSLSELRRQLEKLVGNQGKLTSARKAQHKQLTTPLSASELISYALSHDNQVDEPFETESNNSVQIVSVQEMH